MISGFSTFRGLYFCIANYHRTHHTFIIIILMDQHGKLHVFDHLCPIRVHWLMKMTGVGGCPTNQQPERGQNHIAHILLHDDTTLSTFLIKIISGTSSDDPWGCSGV
jgi:hypothetical protein